MSGAAFTYSEAKLSERLGISRTDIKSIRDQRLTVDSDWKKIAGEVVLSGGGIKRLWRALRERPAVFDLASCLIAPPEKKNGGAVNGTNGESTEILLGHASMPVPVLMTVTRICVNESLVLAQQTLGLDRRTQTVWVGRNENFTVGMELQVVPKKNAAGIWVMTGPLPQRRYTPDEWRRRQAAGMQG